MNQRVYDNNDVFVYKSLSSGESIRLLEFTWTDQSPSEPLRGNLIEVPLENDLLWYALSYAWEEQLPSHTLLLSADPQSPSQKVLLITSNCEDALRRVLRLWQTVRPSPDSPFRIWIDAVCINQKDVEERNQQVVIMDSIYKNAAQTWVWLGSGNKLAGQAMRRGARLYALQRWLVYLKLGYFTPVIIKSLSNLYLSSAMTSAFANRPYWSRMWTLQEIVVSTTVFILYGDEPAINYITIGLLMHRLSDVQASFSIITHWIFWMRRLNLSDIDTLFKPLHLVLMPQFKLASEPRDKIYAARALGSEALRSVPVDYDRPVHEIYHLATKAVVEELGNIGLLEVGIPMPPEDACPTWTIDFSSLHRVLWDLLLNNDRGPENMIRSVNNCKISPNGLEMHTRGHVLHNVAYKFERIPEIGKDVRYPESRPGLEALFNAYVRSDQAKDDLILVRRQLRRVADYLTVPFSQVIDKFWELLKCSWASDDPRKQSLPLMRKTGVRKSSTIREWIQIVLGDISSEEESEATESSNLLSREATNVGEILQRFHNDLAMVRLHSAVLFFLKGRTMFLTSENARIGLCHQEPLPGDKVVLVHGSWIPLVLRNSNSDGQYHLISNAFVEDIHPMYESFGQEKELEDIVII